MRMREENVYFRAATRHDVIDDGRAADLIADFEGLAEAELAFYRDLDANARWRRCTPDGIAPLAERVGRGFHQSLRLLHAVEPDASPSATVSAGAHPYSGAWTALVDLRLPNAWFSDERVALYRRAVERWVALLEPIWAYSHAADDNAIQNIGSPTLLARGYGVDVESVDLATNPGRETSRAEFRYAAEWMTFWSDELLERAEVSGPPPSEVVWDERYGGRIYWLAPSPLAFESSEPPRGAQRALRAHLGIETLAEGERRDFGYWDRSPG